MYSSELGSYDSHVVRASFSSGPDNTGHISGSSQSTKHLGALPSTSVDSWSARVLKRECSCPHLRWGVHLPRRLVVSDLSRCLRMSLGPPKSCTTSAAGSIALALTCIYRLGFNTILQTPTVTIRPRRHRSSTPWSASQDQITGDIIIARILRSMCSRHPPLHFVI